MVRARARGFTMIEVMVASSIFAVVMVLALTEFSSSTRLIKAGAVEADLRRVGQRALDEISYDLRGSAIVVDTGLRTTASSIEFQRVLGYNTTSSPPKVIFEAPLGGGKFYSRKFHHVGDKIFAENPKVPSGYVLCGEVEIFNITSSQYLDGVTQENKPTTLTITLQLKRRVGFIEGKFWDITSRLETTLFLRETNDEGG